ncbi:hypothetical protein NDU88_000834 [Pleurodeles waltl]|uniref:Uncharacterized protein n=1 Tax=Pleurodeles waltl TaxID=8319 RepID=A0AAV7SXI6_PLEWA|nr:hypothetical protein NDU88_000834 [Pleurodeles waltl]
MGRGHRNTPPQGGPPQRRVMDQPRIEGGCNGSERHLSPTRRTRSAPNGAGAGHVSPSRPQETRRRIGLSAPRIFGTPLSRKRASFLRGRGNPATQG